MSQAEVAGGTFTPPHEFPSKGYLLRDFVLTSAEGLKVSIVESAFRLQFLDFS